jgi:hypothetical protein
MLCAAAIVVVVTTAVQAAVIKGVVRDSVSSAGVSGVTVQLKNTATQATTDAQGKFTLNIVSSINPQHPAINSRPEFFFDRTARTIRWDKDRPVSLKLYDLRGAGLGQTARPSATGSFAVPRLSDGMYVLESTTDNGRQFIKVVVAGQQLSLGPAGSAIAQSPSSNAKAAAAPITMEAESMTFSGYMVDAGRTHLIMVDPSGAGTGTATKAFPGASGMYNVMLGFVPENDGHPNVKLSVGATRVLDVTYPAADGYFNLDVLLEDTAQNVAINNGDVIRIEGTVDSEAYARVDRIVFSDINNTVLVFSKSGYATRELPATVGDTNVVVKLMSAGSYNDGSANAPAGVAPQRPTILNGYVKRPAWQAAGVDYGVGYPSATVLKNPATISRPGVSVNLTTGLIRVDGTSGVVFDGYDFTLGIGYSVAFLNSSPNGVVKNSKFYDSGIYADASSAGLYVGYCVMDGGGSQGGSSAMITSSGGGTTVIEYNWVKNFPQHVVEMNTGGTLIYRYNLLENGGTVAGSHLNYSQYMGSSWTNCKTIFNTVYQQKQAAGGEGFQFPSGSGTFTNNELAWNTLIAASTKGNESMSYMINAGASGTTANNTLHDNYFDPTGAYGTVYPGSSSAGMVFFNNWNMVTGAALPTNP